MQPLNGSKGRTMTRNYPPGQPVEGQHFVNTETGEEFEWRRGRWRPTSYAGWDMPTLVASIVAGVLGMALPAIDWALSAAATAVAGVLWLMQENKGRVRWLPQRIVYMALIGIGALGAYLGYRTMQDIANKLGG
jgi:hypothetical protein